MSAHITDIRESLNQKYINFKPAYDQFQGGGSYVVKPYEEFFREYSEQAIPQEKGAELFTVRSDLRKCAPSTGDL